MSTTTAARIIPAEFVGQVRAACARLTADLPRFRSVVEPMVQQFEADARRGRLTPWLWSRHAARWNEATDGPDRVAFHPPDAAARRDGTLAEDRAMASELRLNEWRDAEGEWPWEPGIDLGRYTLAVAGKRVILSLGILASASAHGLGRRLQRGGGTIAQAVADMAPAESWTKLAGLGNLAPVVIPTRSGVWRGVMLSLVSENAGRIRIPGLRTWLHDDDLRDGQLESLRRLRDLGPEHANAPAMVRQLGG